MKRKMPALALTFVFICVTFLNFAPLRANAVEFLTLDLFNGPPGKIINVSGGGFAPGENVAVYVGSDPLPSFTSVAGSDSLFGPTPLLMPLNSPFGHNVITAKGESSGLTAMNSYYVEPLLPSISATSFSNTPGSSILVLGEGFGSGENVKIELGSNSTIIPADPSGSFDSASVIIPNVPPGTYELTATGEVSNAKGIAYFYVGGFYAGVIPSEYYVFPGGHLNFSGSGFGANETLEIFVDSSADPLGTILADSGGSFLSAGNILIPNSFAGTAKTFTVKGSTSGAISSATVTIGSFYSSITPSAFYVLPGNNISFSGTGFAPLEPVEITIPPSSEIVGIANAGPDGTFTDQGSFAVPFSLSGQTATFNARGAESGGEGTVGITIGSLYPFASPSVYYLLPGSVLSFSGGGFAPGERINILETSSGSTVATIDGGTSGSFDFAGAFSVPFSFSGKAIEFSLTGENSNASTTVPLMVGSLYPMIIPSAYYVLPGHAITLSGSGFAPEEDVELTAGSETGITVKTDTEGAFAGMPFTAPFSSGLVEVSGKGMLSNATSTATVTIGDLYPQVEPSSYYLMPGDSLSFAGIGFGPLENILIKKDGALLQTIPADQSGAFTYSLGQIYSGGAFSFQGEKSGILTELIIGMGSLYPVLSADNYYVNPGTGVTITGTGFLPNETIDLAVSGGAPEVITADEGGNFMKTINAPFSEATFNVTASGEISGASSELTIILAPFQAAVLPSAWYVTPGTEITFTGSGFAPNETVNISLNGSALKSILAGGDGSFSEAITIPMSASSALFSFVGETSGASLGIPIALASFYSGIVFSTYYALGGSPLAIDGIGFAGNEDVEIVFDGSSLGIVKADGTGAFTFTTSIPFATPGVKDITATGLSSGVSATGQLTVAQIFTINLELGNYAAAPGEPVTVIGSGYLPSETLSVKTDRTGDQVLHTIPADPSGSFNDSGFVIPADFPPGLITITITGNHSLLPRDVLFYVTGG